MSNDKGESIGGVTVTLWPKTADPSSPTDGVKGTTTDQNGKFRLPGLAPGEYYTAAWEEIDTGLANYHEFLARFNGEAAAITLAESGQASVKAKLIPNEKILAEVAKLP